MNYKQKYLKYKNKYLNLKAGSDRAETKDFTIYTTGLADGYPGLADGYSGLADGYPGSESLASYWIKPDGIFDNILKLIPSNYRISIVHSDILHLRDEIELETELNGFFGLEDLKKDDRVISSTFTTAELNFEVISRQDIKSYIIIDIAHVFLYTSIQKQVIYQPYSGDQQTIMPLNVVYFGFPPYYISQILLHSTIFRISDEGYITTYIDRLIEIGYPFSVENPSNFITQFASRLREDLIKVTILGEMERRFGDYDGSDRWKEITNTIGHIIMSLLFTDGITPDVMYAIIYDEIQMIYL